MSESLHHPGAGSASEGLLKMIRGRAKALARASLLALKPQGPPLGEVLAGQSPLVGAVTCFRDGRKAELPCSLTRKGDDPAGICLAVDGWPDDWTALAVFLHQFRFWQFPPVAVQVGWGEAPRPDEPSTPADDSRQMAARDADTVALGAYSMSCHGSGDELDELVFAADSAAVSFTYFPDSGMLDVVGSLPEGSDGETVVAELRSRAGGPSVCRAVHLDYRLPDGRHKKAVHRLFLPEQRGDVELVVRPMADAELSLLEVDAVRALLARQDYLSMPMEPAGGGFVFSASSPDQRQSAADPATRWALSVVQGSEG